MNLLNSVWEALQYLIGWFAEIIKAFPNWFGIGGATVLLIVFLIIRSIRR